MTDRGYYPRVKFLKAFAEVYGIPWWLARSFGINPWMSPEAAQVMVNDAKSHWATYRNASRRLHAAKKAKALSATKEA